MNTATSAVIVVTMTSNQHTTAISSLAVSTYIGSNYMVSTGFEGNAVVWSITWTTSRNDGEISSISFGSATALTAIPASNNMYPRGAVILSDGQFFALSYYWYNSAVRKIR